MEIVQPSSDGGGGGGTPGGNIYDVQTNDGMGGFYGDDGFKYGEISKQASLNSGSAPSDEQLKLSANGLGGLGLLSYSAGDQEILFDIDWEGGDYVATHTTIGSIRETDDGMDFFENDNQVIGMSADLGSPRIRIRPNGNVGIGTTTPTAKVDIVPNSTSWPTPSGSTTSVNFPTGSGFSLGTGNQTYQIYAGGSISGVLTYSSAFNTISSTNAPSAVDYNPGTPTNASIVSPSSFGTYTQDGSTISYRIRAIYSGVYVGNDWQSISGVTFNNSGDSAEVSLSWGAANVTPSGYLIERTWSNNGNVPDYQISNTPTPAFSDLGSGWGSDPGLSAMFFTVGIITPSIPSTLDYAFYNATNGTHLNAGNNNTPTDDNTWVGGMPINTPNTFNFPALNSEGPSFFRGSVTFPYLLLSVDYLISQNNWHLGATNNITVTLPECFTFTGAEFVITNMDNSTITVATSSNQNINGSTTYSTWSGQYSTIIVQSTGSEWIIISKY